MRRGLKETASAVRSVVRGLMPPGAIEHSVREVGAIPTLGRNCKTHTRRRMGTLPVVKRTEKRRAECHDRHASVLSQTSNGIAFFTGGP